MDFTGERVVPGKTPENVYVEHVARYNFALAYVKGKTVLDVACGTGYGTAILASEAGSVVGIDLDRETIAYARQNYPHPEVTYLLGDILRLPLPDESVEVVACFETIEHVADDRKCLQELRRVLQPGGICLLSTPNRAVFSPGKTLTDQPGNIFHHREYTLDEFRDLLVSCLRF
ncbi:MAG: class I SAM-dependent methyltransferase [Bacillota bacterium]